MKKSATGFIKVEVKIKPNKNIPKRVVKFMSWYLDYRWRLLKIKHEDPIINIFLKIKAVIIILAGEVTLGTIALYLWLCRVILGAEPEWW